MPLKATVAILPLVAETSRRMIKVFMFSNKYFVDTTRKLYGRCNKCQFSVTAFLHNGWICKICHHKNRVRRPAKFGFKTSMHSSINIFILESAIGAKMKKQQN